TEAGRLDPTFCSGGITRTSLLPGCCDAAFGITVAPNGNLFVGACAGCGSSHVESNIVALEYLSTGGADTSFGRNGRSTITGWGFYGFDPVAHGGPEGAVTVDPEGRLVLGVAKHLSSLFARFEL